MDGFHKIFVLILDAFSIQFHFWRNYVDFKVLRNTFFTTTLSYHNKIPVSTQNIILNCSIWFDWFAFFWYCCRVWSFLCVKNGILLQSHLLAKVSRICYNSMNLTRSCTWSIKYSFGQILCCMQWLLWYCVCLCCLK